MMNREYCFRKSGLAFTLIELLVVIAVIGVLAALIFPITNAMKKRKMINVARAGLGEMETAIDAYTDQSVG